MKINLMLVAGVIMLLIGAGYSLAVLVVDPTPPTFIDSNPADGGTYTQIKILQVTCSDPESGIEVVSFKIDSGTTWYLSPVAGSATQFAVAIDTINSVGTHTFIIVIRNGAGVQIIKTGSFTIGATALAGKWYVSGTWVSLSTQTVYVVGPGVNFTFAKSAGPADTSITCTVKCSSYGLLETLPLVSAGIWQKTINFNAGSYNVELRADDGSGPITMGVVSFDIEGNAGTYDYAAWFTWQNMMIAVGVLFTGYGLYSENKKEG
jgi:hypothetical protein